MNHSVRRPGVFWALASGAMVVLFLLSACSMPFGGGRGVSFSEAEFICSDLDTTFLWPAHNDPPEVDYQASALEYEDLAVTDWTSCELGLDVNFDGIVNAGDWDRGADTVYLKAGQDVSKAQSLEETVAVWGPSCMTGELEFRDTAGWDATSACVEEELTWEITYYLVGEKPDGYLASISCTVYAPGMPVEGRAQELDEMCNSFRDTFIQ